MAGKPRPDFIPAESDVHEVRSLLERLQDNLTYERAILSSMKRSSGIGMLDTIQDQERRCAALVDMAEQTDAWMRTLWMSRRFEGVAQA